jgi:hypothetical protein
MNNIHAIYKCTNLEMILDTEEIICPLNNNIGQIKEYIKIYN